MYIKSAYLGLGALAVGRLVSAAPVPNSGGGIKVNDGEVFCDTSLSGCFGNSTYSVIRNFCQSLDSSCIKGGEGNHTQFAEPPAGFVTLSIYNLQDGPDYVIDQGCCVSEFTEVIQTCVLHNSIQSGTLITNGAPNMLFDVNVTGLHAADCNPIAGPTAWGPPTFVSSTSTATATPTAAASSVAKRQEYITPDGIVCFNNGSGVDHNQFGIGITSFCAFCASQGGGEIAPGGKTGGSWRVGGGEFWLQVTNLLEDKPYAIDTSICGNAFLSIGNECNDKNDLNSGGRFELAKYGARFEIVVTPPASLFVPTGSNGIPPSALSTKREQDPTMTCFVPRYSGAGEVNWETASEQAYVFCNTYNATIIDPATHNVEASYTIPGASLRFQASYLGPGTYGIDSKYCSEAYVQVLRQCQWLAETYGGDWKDPMTELHFSVYVDDAVWPAGTSNPLSNGAALEKRDLSTYCLVANPNGPYPQVGTNFTNIESGVHEFCDSIDAFQFAPNAISQSFIAVGGVNVSFLIGTPSQFTATNGWSADECVNQIQNIMKTCAGGNGDSFGGVMSDAVTGALLEINIDDSVWPSETPHLSMLSSLAASKVTVVSTADAALSKRGENYYSCAAAGSSTEAASWADIAVAAEHWYGSVAVPKQDPQGGTVSGTTSANGFQVDFSFENWDPTYPLAPLDFCTTYMQRIMEHCTSGYGGYIWPAGQALKYSVRINNGWLQDLRSLSKRGVSARGGPIFTCLSSNSPAPASNVAGTIDSFCRDHNGWVIGSGIAPFLGVVVGSYIDGTANVNIRISTDAPSWTIIHDDCHSHFHTIADNCHHDDGGNIAGGQAECNDLGTRFVIEVNEAFWPSPDPTSSKRSIQTHDSDTVAQAWEGTKEIISRDPGAKNPTCYPQGSAAPVSQVHAAIDSFCSASNGHVVKSNDFYHQLEPLQPGSVSLQVDVVPADRSTTIETETCKAIMYHIVDVCSNGAEAIGGIGTQFGYANWIVDVNHESHTKRENTDLGGLLWCYMGEPTLPYIRIFDAIAKACDYLSDGPIKSGIARGEYVSVDSTTKINFEIHVSSNHTGDFTITTDMCRAYMQYIIDRCMRTPGGYVGNNDNTVTFTVEVMANNPSKRDDKIIDPGPGNFPGHYDCSHDAPIANISDITSAISDCCYAHAGHPIAAQGTTPCIDQPMSNGGTATMYIKNGNDYTVFNSFVVCKEAPVAVLYHCHEPGSSAKSRGGQVTLAGSTHEVDVVLEQSPLISLSERDNSEVSQPVTCHNNQTAGPMVNILTTIDEACDAMDGVLVPAYTRAHRKQYFDDGMLSMYITPEDARDYTIDASSCKFWFDIIVDTCPTIGADGTIGGQTTALGYVVFDFIFNNGTSPPPPALAARDTTAVATDNPTGPYPLTCYNRTPGPTLNISNTIDEVCNEWDGSVAGAAMLLKDYEIKDGPLNIGQVLMDISVLAGTDSYTVDSDSCKYYFDLIIDGCPEVWGPGQTAGGFFTYPVMGNVNFDIVFTIAGQKLAARDTTEVATPNAEPFSKVECFGDGNYPLTAINYVKYGFKDFCNSFNGATAYEDAPITFSKTYFDFEMTSEVDVLPVIPGVESYTITPDICYQHFLDIINVCKDPGPDGGWIEIHGSNTFYGPDLIRFYFN